MAETKPSFNSLLTELALAHQRELSDIAERYAPGNGDALDGIQQVTPMPPATPDSLPSPPASPHLMATSEKEEARQLSKKSVTVLPLPVDLPRRSSGRIATNSSVDLPLPVDLPQSRRSSGGRIATNSSVELGHFIGAIVEDNSNSDPSSPSSPVKLPMSCTSSDACQDEKHDEIMDLPGSSRKTGRVSRDGTGSESNSSSPSRNTSFSLVLPGAFRGSTSTSTGSRSQAFIGNHTTSIIKAIGRMGRTRTGDSSESDPMERDEVTNRGVLTLNNSWLNFDEDGEDVKPLRLPQLFPGTKRRSGVMSMISREGSVGQLIARASVSSGTVSHPSSGCGRGSFVTTGNHEEEGAPTSSFCQRFVSQPSSTRRIIWELSGLLMLIYDLVMVPLQVYGTDEGDVVKTFQQCTTIFWTCDIAVSFLAGFHSNGLIELQLSKIAKRYLKTWFLFDFTIIAGEWTFIFIKATEAAERTVATSQISELHKISRTFRVVRLLRIMKFQQLISDATRAIRSETKKILVGVLKIVIFIIIFNHFIACIFYGIHHLRDDPADKSWVYVNFVDSDGFAYRYWTSLHWSLTQFTPASMEVVPRNSAERFYTCFVLLMALITFSTFISSITEAMTCLRKINDAEMKHEALLHRYLSEHNISRHLAARIISLIKERRAHTGGQALVKEEDVDLFRMLPEGLKSDLRFEAYCDILCTHPFFESYCQADANAIKSICKSSVRERSLIYREELYEAGASITHMIFIMVGTLRHTYVTMQDGQMKLDAHTGEWVCEAALWCDTFELCSPITAHARDGTHISMLHAQSFMEVVRRFPRTRRLVAEYAKLFADYVIHEDVEFPNPYTICHNVESLQKVAAQVFFEEEPPTPPVARSFTKGLLSLVS